MTPSPALPAPRRNSSTTRVLPIPVSPSIRTTARWPDRLEAQAASSSASAGPRPTMSGVKSAADPGRWPGAVPATVRSTFAPARRSSGPGSTSSSDRSRATAAAYRARASTGRPASLSASTRCRWPRSSRGSTPVHRSAQAAASSQSPRSDAPPTSWSSARARFCRSPSRSTSSQVRNASPPTSSSPVRKSPLHHSTASTGRPSAIAASKAVASSRTAAGSSRTSSPSVASPSPTTRFSSSNACLRDWRALASSVPSHSSAASSARHTDRGDRRARNVRRLSSFRRLDSRPARRLDPHLAQGPKQDHARALPAAGCNQRLTPALTHGCGRGGSFVNTMTNPAAGS